MSGRTLESPVCATCVFIRYLPNFSAAYGALVLYAELLGTLGRPLAVLRVVSKQTCNSVKKEVAHAMRTKTKVKAGGTIWGT
jgi:hypothetical protein